MSRDNIWEGLVKLFPYLSERVESYTKIGSKTLKLYMSNGQTLIFLYNDPWDWTLGTKVWRNKPRKMKVDFNEIDAELIKKEDTINGNLTDNQ